MGEQTVFDVRANLKRKIEYVGGKLTITDQNLYFRPHPFNLQTDEVTIPRAKIKTAEKMRVLGVSPNGIRLQLNDGTQPKLVIGFPGGTTRQKIIDSLAGD